MVTYDYLVMKTGKHLQTVKNRVKILKLEAKYESIHGRPVRVFSNEEADQIINFKPGKPGRKRKG